MAPGAVLAKLIATDRPPLQRPRRGQRRQRLVQGEFTAIGEPWLEHDERYRRSEEFIRALRGIWTEDHFTFSGDFYRFHDYST